MATQTESSHGCKWSSPSFPSLRSPFSSQQAKAQQQSTQDSMKEVRRVLLWCSTDRIEEIVDAISIEGKGARWKHDWSLCTISLSSAKYELRYAFFILNPFFRSQLHCTKRHVISSQQRRSMRVSQYEEDQWRKFLLNRHGRSLYSNDCSLIRFGSLKYLNLSSNFGAKGDLPMISSLCEKML